MTGRECGEIDLGVTRPVVAFASHSRLRRSGSGRDWPPT
jgi:hypothetical protein